MKTQGEIEATICEGISRFEQEYMGRGRDWRKENGEWRSNRGHTRGPG